MGPTKIWKNGKLTLFTSAFPPLLSFIWIIRAPLVVVRNERQQNKQRKPDGRRWVKPRRPVLFFKFRLKFLNEVNTRPLKQSVRQQTITTFWSNVTQKHDDTLRLLKVVFWGFFLLWSRGAVHPRDSHTGLDRTGPTASHYRELTLDRSHKFN